MLRFLPPIVTVLAPKCYGRVFLQLISLQYQIAQINNKSRHRIFLQKRNKKVFWYNNTEVMQMGIRRKICKKEDSQNDDILKKSSNVLEIASSENTSKIKGFKALPSVVSNAPMGTHRKI